VTAEVAVKKPAAEDAVSVELDALARLRSLDTGGGESP